MKKIIVSIILIVLVALVALTLFAGIWWLLPFRDDASDAPFIIAHPQGGLAPDRKAEKGTRFFLSADISTSKKCYLDNVSIQIEVPSEIEVERINSQNAIQNSLIIINNKILWQGNLKDNAEISIDFPFKAKEEIISWSNSIVFYERVNFRTTRKLPKWPSGCYERTFYWPKSKEGVPNSLEWKKCASKTAG